MLIDFTVTLYALSVIVYAEESDTTDERLRRHSSVGLDSHPEAIAQWKQEGGTNHGEGGLVNDYTFTQS